MQFYKFSTILFFQFLAFGLFAQADWQAKVDPSILDKLTSEDEVTVLVQMKDRANVAASKQLRTKDEKASFVFNEVKKVAERSQQSIRTYLEDQGISYESLHIVNILKLDGNLELIKSIAERDNVKNVQDNPYTKFDGPVRSNETSAARAVEWGIQNMNADDVWDLGHRGEGVVVGGQDTGYDWEHPALIKKYRGLQSDGTADHNYHWHDAIHEYNTLHDSLFNPCGLDVAFPCDDNRHGTHTMGTMVGSEGENEIGVAPDSKWCACRNMDRGWGSPFTYLECFEWFLAPTDLNNENPDPTMAPHVIANSWGCPEIEGCNPMNFELLNTAVLNLRAAGTVVVVSAGNSGNDCSTVSNPAAIFEGSFTVGAHRSNDTIANFSSRGPVTVDESGRMKPNISAPGVGVRSTVLDGEYATFSGTSMAGPHVVGVVALMISANPELAGQVDIIEDIIESTAIPATTDQECGGVPGTTIPNHTYGWGRIDALAAVKKGLTIFPVSTASISASAVSVFPNPFQDQFQLVFENINGPTSIELFDLNGRMIQRQMLNLKGNHNEMINALGLSAGMYFYKVSSSEGTFKGKIIKR